MYACKMPGRKMKPRQIFQDDKSVWTCLGLHKNDVPEAETPSDTTEHTHRRRDGTCITRKK